MREKWIAVIGYEAYLISNFGRVFSKHRNIVLKPMVERNRPNQNYPRVGLSLNGVLKRFAVHRLVAIHFIPNPNNYPMVLHKDDNPENPCVTNLMWGTGEINQIQSIRRGRGNKLFGEGHARSKITEKIVLEIRSRWAKNESYKSICKHFNMPRTSVRDVISRRLWKHI